MKDESIFTKKQPKEISEGLQSFIDSMVEEIVLEGKPFDTQKKYLKKFSENEGLDFDKLEADIANFIEILDSLKTAFNKLLVKLAEEKGKECHISEDTIQKLVKHTSQPHQKEQEKNLTEKKDGTGKGGSLNKIFLFSSIGLLLLVVILLLFKWYSDNNVSKSDTEIDNQRDTVVNTQYNSEAEQQFRSDAERGNAEAQYCLGYCYYCGAKGLPKSYSEAIIWFIKAANQGYARAQYELGNCYVNGLGVSQNIEEAKIWYEKAADQGYSRAMDELERIGEKTECSPSKSTTSLNNNEYVDLGLSVNWATCNVGANRPEDYGMVVAWGETSPKSSYTWSNYKYRISGTNSGDIKLSKYITESWCGSVDNIKNLELIDDVANVLWGDGWRMPTKNEFEELLKHCSWNWISQKGIKGYIVTSKKVGFTNKSIFFPVDKNHYYHYTYWSSSINIAQPTMAWYLCIDEKSQSMQTMFRIDKRLVRAVRKK